MPIISQCECIFLHSLFNLLLTANILQYIKYNISLQYKIKQYDRATTSNISTL